MRQEWDDFRTAMSFLTIFPVGKDLLPEPERLARSMHILITLQG